MDKTLERTRLEEILAEWDMDKDLTQTWGHNITQSTSYEPVTCSVSDTINLGALGANSNISLSSPYTVTGSIGTTAFPNTIYTTSTLGGNTPWLRSNGLSPKIQLDGEGADIEVNGWSLVDAVKRIEERLGLFQPNPKLEAEWEELRALGEQYRQLEQHIKDKQATWDRIKAMPAPDID